MADTATAPAADSGSKRPEKPDEAKFKSDLEQAEKVHKKNQEEFNAIRNKLNEARPGKGGSANDRWQQLVDEQKGIRSKQGEHKSSRQTQQTKYDANDREIKNLITQQKDARSRVGFKNAQEIEQKIASLMKQVDSGQMKLVDEKKTLTEVSNLRRQMKSFGGLDDLQTKIDAKKNENAELKKTFDNAETKALSDKYEANQKELDEIKAGRDDVNKNFDKLKAEREALYEKQNVSWRAIQDLKDKYYAQRKEYKEYEDKQYQQRRDRQRQERDQYEKERRKRAAEARLEEASSLAYSDEILTAEGIIRHFDPSYTSTESEKGPSKFAASAQRAVDESGFKGMSVMKKEEEDFFTGAGGKKKGKKGNKAANENKFNLSIDIIQGLSKLGVDQPSNQSEVPATVEKLKEKVAYWKANQKTETEKNVEKAKQEIERLEQEAEAASSAASTAPPAKRGPRQDRSKKANMKDAGVDDSGREVNVDADAVAKDEKDATADVAEELKATKIEDADNEEVATA
ncbi:multicopy suppressor of BFA (Brefeldin A) [Lithohypha guttulata]|uniref:multicopy suppressor of BFA (Brefeldin A) n=1 Tax=Lithohypha guttulata TaxID=1690604 RepID=UPI002DDFC07B|nr:multicopy suppressor of BFA (Brefeldin A) [Lithohypha guttulata]